MKMGASHTTNMTIEFSAICLTIAVTTVSFSIQTSRIMYGTLRALVRLALGWFLFYSNV